VTSRIAVVGTLGSGKTTLARRLADQFELPHYCVDDLFWLTGWERRPSTDFSAAVRQVLSERAWVLDGVLKGSLDEELWERADVVVWIDSSRAGSAVRLTRRSISRLRTRAVVCGGNRETLLRLINPKTSVLAIAMYEFRSYRRSLKSRWQARLGRGDAVIRLTPRRCRGRLDWLSAELVESLRSYE
jgi:adenylate kinase family enzyme